MQNTTLNIAGLHTNPSDLSEVPPGALKTANNIDIDRPSIATPRKGFSRFGDEFSNPAARVGSVFFFDGKTLVRRSDNVLMYWDGNDWQNYTGTVAEPETGVPVRMVPSGKSALFTTGEGIKKLSSATGFLNPAGLKAPYITAVDSGYNTEYLIGRDERVSYRITIVTTDEHGVTVESPPSEVICIANHRNLGPNYTRLTPNIYFRPNNTVSGKYRIYRSEIIDRSVTDFTPSDEMRLVYESNVQSFTTDSTVITGFGRPGMLRQSLPLYTNSSQQGIEAANNTPPIASDIAVFNGYTFYMAPVFPHRLLLRLLAVGSGDGSWMDWNDTVTIGSQTYTAKSAETPASREFRLVFGSGDVYNTFTSSSVDTTADTITINNHGLRSGDQIRITTTGTLPAPLIADMTYIVLTVTTNTFQIGLSASPTDFTTGGSGTHTIKLLSSKSIFPVLNGVTDRYVEMTALSLVRVINADSSSPVTATYMSDLSTEAGLILLEAKDPATSFGVAATGFSLSDTWSPVLSATKTDSSNDYEVNKLAWSKQFQSESVPLTNVHPGIGSARAKALRVLATRDSLFILKQDGVYRLTGATADTFSVEDFDTSVQVIAPRAACVLDNLIFCLTSEGPAIVSDLGVDKTFGNPVLKELKDLRGTTSAKVAHFNTNTWAVAHDKRYILSVGYLDDSSNPQTKLYVFNTRTKTWVTWSKKLTCAETSPTDGLLYAGSADYAYLLCQDRTTHDDTDTGSTVGIDSEIEWVVKSLAGPAASSQFSEVKVIMIDDFPASASLITSTDTNSTPITQTITTHAVGSGRRPHRQSVPRNHQRATLLNVKVRHNAAGYYEIAGISVEGSAVSTRTQK